MKRARFIRSLSDGGSEWHGQVNLYRVSEPVPYTHQDRREETHFIISSAVNNKWCHETMIFPGNEAGEILDYCEVSCTRNTTDHLEALFNAGYEYVSMPAES